MKNLGLILLVGLGMLLIGLALGKIANLIAPGLEAEYQNAEVFRPFTDPKMLLFLFMPFITAGLMLWIWNLSKGSMKGSTFTSKGLNFGLIYWTLTFPGMIMSYCTFQLSAAIVISWTISNLGETLFAGLIYARWRH